jgi:thiamine kinase-like enzyme
VRAAVEETSSEPNVSGVTAADLRALKQIDMLDGKIRSVEPLTGGLTNHNYRVDTADHSYVARMPSRHGALLAIDRNAELYNSRAAAEAGVAPAVIATVPPTDTCGGAMLIEWIAGQTLSADAVRDGRTTSRIASACQRLHSGPRFINDFNMFDVQRGYLSIVLENEFRLPDRYLEFQPIVGEIEAAMGIRRQPSVPCHNDLLAENMIDDGKKLWLIDYEYAGNNDPYFELGNIAAESSLTVDQLDELIRAYHGAESKTLLARARLWSLMSHYGWTLWASIQDGVSDLEFDFWSWGFQKYRNAVAMFDGDELEQLITQVRQPA